MRHLYGLWVFSGNNYMQQTVKRFREIRNDSSSDE
jgi:hypothetical protein